MTRDTPDVLPQDISIVTSAHWMEREIEITFTTKLTSVSSTSSKVYVTPEEAEVLRDLLTDYLDNRENPLETE